MKTKIPYRSDMNEPTPTFAASLRDFVAGAKPVPELDEREIERVIAEERK